MLHVNPDGTLLIREHDAVEFDLDERAEDNLVRILSKVPHAERLSAAFDLRWIVNNSKASAEDTLEIILALSRKVEPPPF